MKRQTWERTFWAERTKSLMQLRYQRQVSVARAQQEWRKNATDAVGRSRSCEALSTMTWNLDFYHIYNGTWEAVFK